MLRNEIEHSAEYKRSSDGNQRGGDNDIAQAAVIVVADPEGVPKHSAGKGGGVGSNGRNNLEDDEFPHIPEEGAGHLMLGKKLP